MQQLDCTRIDHRLTQLPAGAGPTAPSLDRPGVLVVDDEHFVRTMLQLGLQQHGFEVHVAANGREAIALYRERREQIALVLLDIQMPDLDGPQTLHALHALNPGVLACFMSGDMGCYDPHELLKCGAARVITKPFYLAQLAKVLRLLLRGEPAN
jgi:DNA-binding response OmpR family regulator